MTWTESYKKCQDEVRGLILDRAGNIGYPMQETLKNTVDDTFQLLSNVCDRLELAYRRGVNDGRGME